MKIELPKIGELDKWQLESLQYIIKEELEKREKHPETTVELIYIEDGCEGFVCFLDKFKKINTEELHNFIIQTIDQGSEVHFSKIEMNKKSYEEDWARYNWIEEDRPKFNINED